VFGSFLSISDSIFIETDEETTEKELSTRERTRYSQTKSLRLFNGVHTFQEDLSASAVQTLTKENGDSILINTTARATVVENYDDQNEASTGSFSHSYEIQKGDRKLQYLGSISTGSRSDSLEQSLKIIESHDFSPCALEQTSAALIRGAVEDLDKQLQESFKLNCMIGQKLNGDFFANVIISDFQGDILKKIELSGELTLEVSEALTLKYGNSYLQGEAPLEDNEDPFQSSSGGDTPFDFSQFLTSGIQIGNVSFVNREQIQGYLHEFEIRHSLSADENSNCSLTNTLNLKFEDHTEPSENNRRLFRLSLNRNCKESGSDSLSISNGYERANDQAVVLSYSKSVETSDDQSSSQVTLGFDLAQTKESREWFYDYNITYKRVNQKGAGSETSFDVFYAENQDSYVVAKHILIAPILHSKRLRDLKDTFREANQEFTLQDIDLCFRTACNTLGTAVTFREEGGVFISAQGETIFEAFGKELELTVTGGFGMDGENEGFGSGSFFSNDRENFVELSVSSPRCQELSGGCLSLGYRKEESSTNLSIEESSTNFSIGGTFKF